MLRGAHRDPIGEILRSCPRTPTRLFGRETASLIAGLVLGVGVTATASWLLEQQQITGPQAAVLETLVRHIAEDQERPAGEVWQHLLYSLDKVDCGDLRQADFEPALERLRRLDRHRL
ncbi:MAG: hypothetical protein ACF8R7_18510 [Phycisphaerales bacterium JB039]